MAESLLNRLLSATSARPRANASPFISGDYTLQQGTNVTLTQLGSVITIDASLAALTRVRANASPYLSGDLTFKNGTNITLAQVGSEITINAAGGAALPSPYTATLVTYESIADSLLITGPSGAYTTTKPPAVVIRGRDNTDTTDEQAGGDAVVRAGDLVAGNLSDAGGGNAWLIGGTGRTSGNATVLGGATSFEGGSAGNARLFGGHGDLPEHAALTNVSGGGVDITGGYSKGTGYGGGVQISGGYGDGGGGYVYITGGSGGSGGVGGGIELTAAGGNTTAGNLTMVAGASSSVGGTATLRGGTGSATGTGGACSVSGGASNDSGNGGALTLTGGAAGASGTSKAGGAVTIFGGGASGTTGFGGSVQIEGGAGTGGGGGLSMQAGAGPTAGAASLAGGAGDTSSTGGLCSVRGGHGGTTGAGGALTLKGGDTGSSATSKAGGAASLTGGSGLGTTGVGGSATVAGGTGTGTGGEVLLTPGTGASSVAARTRVTRGAFTVEESTAVGKQLAETAILTTATTSATLAYSYAMATSESVDIVVKATADNGTTTGVVMYEAVFRRATADNSGNATQQGGGSTYDGSVPAFKLGHALTIALNSNTIEVKVVAAASTSTLWTVAISGVARTGPV